MIAKSCLCSKQPFYHSLTLEYIFLGNNVIDKMYCHIPVDTLMIYGLFFTVRSRDGYLSAPYCLFLPVLSQAMHARSLQRSFYMSSHFHSFRKFTIYYIILHAISAYNRIHLDHRSQRFTQTHPHRHINTHKHKRTYSKTHMNTNTQPTHTALPSQVFTCLVILILELLIEA